MDQFFLNPWALAFAGLAGGIVLLYILKLRRVKAEVSSTLLWDRAVHDFKANAPWQKLRRNILMILQIIALILLAIALARPFIFGNALAGGRTVLVIDTSASMLARDAGPDRLAQAIDAARELVSDFSRNDEGMVIAAGPTPRTLASFTKNKAELEDALNRARDEVGGVADLDSALGLVSSIAKGSTTRVVIFSDGAIPELNPFSTTDLNLGFFPVGEDSENVAIIGAGARQNPYNEEYELFVAVHNYCTQPREVDITFGIDGNLFDVQTVEIGAGQRKEVVMDQAYYLEDPIEVILDLEDDLAEDNRAYIQMPRQTRYKVALCSDSQSFLLRQVLTSLDSIDYYTYENGELRTARAVDAGEEAPQIDVWVVEGNADCVVDPTASYLYIDSTAGDFLPVVAGTKAQMDYYSDPPVILTIVDYDRSHPVMRYVNVSDLSMQAMRRCQKQPWGRQIIEASEGPLLVEGFLEGQRTLYFALDIYESRFPLTPSFPIFMSNAVNYLGKASAGFTGQGFRAGETIDLVAPYEAATVTVSGPDGRIINRIDINTRDFSIGRPTQIGIYRLAYFDAGGSLVEERLVPVSLANADESNIAPSQKIRIQGVDEALAAGAEPGEITGTREVRTNREFYTWLLIAVLLILGVEWYLYHTRAL